MHQFMRFQLRNSGASRSLSRDNRRMAEAAIHQLILPGDLQMIVGVLITFLVVILVLYLINLLPLDGRAKQIARVIVIVIGIVSLLKYLAVF